MSIGIDVMIKKREDDGSMKIKKTIGLAIILLWVASFFTGCSTTVSFKVRRAPEINLAGIKTLKVADVEMDSELSLDMVNDNSGLGGVIDLLGNVGVEVIANKSLKKKFIRKYVSGLENCIAKSGHFKMVKGNPFDAQIKGVVQYKVKDVASQVQEKDSTGALIKREKILRKVSVSVLFNIEDSSGKELGKSKVNVFSQTVGKGIIKQEARDQIMNWDKLVLRTLAKSHTPLLRKIAPYEIYEKRVLEKGDDKSIKAGNKLAKKGQWMEAVDRWKPFENSGSRKDQAASWYNRAVYDEVEGRLEEALSKYEKAKEVSGNPKYNSYIKRVTRRIEDEAILTSSPPL